MVDEQSGTASSRYTSSMTARYSRPAIAPKSPAQPSLRKKRRLTRLALVYAPSTQPRYTRPGRSARADMIDNFALGISHGLMLLAAFLLLRRPDLDREPGPQDRETKAKPSRWGNPGA
jgi:hypothetical protein